MPAYTCKRAIPAISAVPAIPAIPIILAVSCHVLPRLVRMSKIDDADAGNLKAAGADDGLPTRSTWTLDATALLMNPAKRGRLGVMTQFAAW
ncbi:hypothetical protein E4U43_005525 [Claviceps pusilla]|uniref:Uncharacterized protein n=1 Tax=Claviceps pusilla TaxID=123648 RepID=A0A9P7N4F7_9HYPO|nr:hypothetical protein E4U43_005525 [Claviceps pusilla]